MREQLIHVLTEAAEIEHNLLCSYLYAAFSFKRGVEAGLTPREAPVVARWRKLVLSVAVEEMAHLALVNNLLVAIGGSPHFGRPNFPVPPGYHPAGFTIRLTPFDRETLAHFLFLERPAGAPVPDGEKFVERAPAREPPPSRITPSSEDYGTIGELYQLIERQLKSLFRRRGDAAFADPSGSLQLGPEIVKLPGLAVVRGLDDALSALRRIVEQGEGAQNESHDCHFARFGIIEKEWRDLQTANPHFNPAHRAAHDPVMRAPTADEPRVWIRDPQARARLDLANGVYAALISVLYQLYEPASGSTRKALAACALSRMSALSTLGEALARMPAGGDHPEAHAGVTFTSPRNLGPRSDPRLIAERLQELAMNGSEASDPISAAAAELMTALQRT